MKNIPFLPHRMLRRSQQHQGFTLVELMIAVAIVGIIGAIVYPSYQSFGIKTNRAAAQAYLAAISQAEQQYLLDSRSYTSVIADLNQPIPTSVSNFYTVTIATTVGPPATFVATATPIAGTKQADDGILSIDNVGTKLPAANW